MLAMLQIAQCQHSSIDHETNSRRSVRREDSRTAKAILTATINAIGGSDVLTSINNFAYHASRYDVFTVCVLIHGSR